MKKFVECSITNRQTVKGTILCTANAISAANEIIGKFVVKSLELPNSKGIFVKYIPCTLSFDSSKYDDHFKRIISLKLVSDDPLELSAVLALIKIRLLENPTLSPSMKLFIRTCVSVEDSTIQIVPIQSADVFTDFVNTYMANNGWFGWELKVDPSLAENVPFQFSTVSLNTHFEPETSAKIGSSWYCKD